MTALALLGGAAAAAAPLKVAVLPLREGATGAEARELERALVEALKKLPDVELANPDKNGGLAAPRNTSLEARVDQRARAQALAKEVGAQRVVALEAAKLGEGRVLYLQGLDATGKPIGSTTVALGGESGPVAPGDETALRGGLVRLLRPEAHVGRIKVKLDLADAILLVDGKAASAAALKGEPIEVPVGTHTLRATHPAYRDFLRFIDVGYDHTQLVEVNMAAFPLTEGEMIEKQRREAQQKKRAWWQSWWVPTVAAVLIVGAATGITFAARPGFSVDQTTPFRPLPGP